MGCVPSHTLTHTHTHTVGNLVARFVFIQTHTQNTPKTRTRALALAVPGPWIFPTLYSRSSCLLLLLIVLHHHWCGATVYEMIAGPLISVHGGAMVNLYIVPVCGFFLCFAVSFPIFATSRTHTLGVARARSSSGRLKGCVRWGRAQQQRQKMYFAVDLETSIELSSRLWRFQTPPGILLLRGNNWDICFCFFFA